MTSHVNIAVQPSFAEIAGKLDTPAMKARVAELIRRYPSPQAALLQVLWLAQQELSWMPNAAIEWSATQCRTSPAHAFGVATFYTMYLKAPAGKFLLQICQNVTCHLKGAEEILAHAEKTLGITSDGAHTTADGLFTLLRVECLGACGNGPVMQVNDDFATDIISDKLTMPAGVPLTPERFDKIIAWCRAHKDSGRLDSGLLHDALGGTIHGDLGHPGAEGASAVGQKKDYAPAAPALAVKAELRKTADGVEQGVAITWKAAPEITELRVESLTGNDWNSVGKATGKDKEFLDAQGKFGSTYRIVAVSGERVAKPSNAAKVGS